MNSALLVVGADQPNAIQPQIVGDVMQARFGTGFEVPDSA